MTDEEIDQILLAHVSTDWRKAARVIGNAMSDIKIRVDGFDDDYLTAKLKSLKERGLIESFGDLTHIGYSEVRLPLARP